ncbi:HAD family acid phosphatase [Streptomyces sp. NPDC049555]|uniref:HAD family acid phosphatase n=1 Tax=Streptomyces sp. NPDC049555 TaxID=3154930 RepID=UPI003440B688
MTAMIRARRAAAAAVAALALTLAGAATAPAQAAAPQTADARTFGPAGLKGVDYAVWQRDVQAVVDRAKPYITERTAHPDGTRPAIVLDIDNSSLETDFHWAAVPTPAIRPVLELTRYAHERGVAVFFVTARPGILDGYTEWNLRTVGYPVDGLYVRHLPDLFHDVSTYKTAKRAAIEAQGYTVVANIGNHDTDLSGGHAERTFKLPDYDGKLS